MPRLGLRYQLLFWFMVVGVTPAAIGIAFLYGHSRAERALESDAALQARVDAAVERFTSALDLARREMVLVADQAQRARELRPRLEWDGAAGVLSTWGDRAPVPVNSLVIHDAEGALQIGYRWRASPGAWIDAAGGRALSAQAVSGGRVAVGEGGRSDHGESSVFGVAVPLTGAEGAVLGALYGAIPTEWFAQTLAGSLDGGSLWITDDAGRTMVATAGGAEASQSSITVSRHVDVPGASTPWTLSVAVPQAAVAAKAELPLHLALIGTAVVLALAFAWGVSGTIVRPIRTIDEGTRRIAQGDLDFQISTKTSNELERLTGSFQQMAYDLKRAQERLTKAERLAAIGEARSDLHRAVADHLARAGSAGQRLQGRPDLPSEVRERVNEMVDAIAGAQTMTQQLEQAPDRTVDPAPRSRESDAAMPPRDHRAEGVA
ncbi:MAG: HAMP domain-containing protein [Nitrospirota bacterium]